MDNRVRDVLNRLEARSASEQARLEDLRRRGGSSLREVAGELMLDVGRDVGSFLNLLVKLTSARTIVEVGGSVGYSTIWLAEAARATGGRMLSLEPDAGKHAEQRSNLEAAGLIEYVDLRRDDANELLPALPGPIDLVLLDHWKELYVREFVTLWPKLRRSGLIVADNILVPAKNAPVIQRYLEHVRATADAQTMTLPLGDGVELTLKM
ncbi:MAG TPA: class I SAM-dependent methyltransferase [Burkholderiaceae bacterium]|nr:class I SAM-dependent methyltransferase [Burkholderiaceae bacterium]